MSKEIIMASQFAKVNAAFLLKKPIEVSLAPLLRCV